MRAQICPVKASDLCYTTLDERAAAIDKLRNTVSTLENQIASHRKIEFQQERELSRRHHQITELQSSVAWQKEQPSSRTRSVDDPVSKQHHLTSTTHLNLPLLLASLAFAVVVIALIVWILLSPSSKMRLAQDVHNDPTANATSARHISAPPAAPGSRSPAVQAPVIPSSSSSIHPLPTGSDFDRVISATQPSLVVFCASWAMVCRHHFLEAQAVATKYSKRGNFYSVDIDTIPTVAKRYSIEAVPVTMIFREGEPLIGHVGVFPAGEFDRFAADYLK
jgi:hypothetical protein